MATQKEALELSQRWIEAWNSRDLESVLSHYHPDVLFQSPRVAAAFKKTGGQVGSPDGTLTGTAALRPYFKQAIDTLLDLRLELLQVLEGPPGWFAMHYTRETGAKVVECFRLGCPLDEQQQAQAQGPRFVITAVMVFYEAVC